MKGETKKKKRCTCTVLFFKYAPISSVAGPLPSNIPEFIRTKHVFYLCCPGPRWASFLGLLCYSVFCRSPAWSSRFPRITVFPFSFSCGNSKSPASVFLPSHWLPATLFPNQNQSGAETQYRCVGSHVISGVKLTHSFRINPEHLRPESCDHKTYGFHVSVWRWSVRWCLSLCVDKLATKGSHLSVSNSSFLYPSIMTSPFESHFIIYSKFQGYYVFISSIKICYLKGLKGQFPSIAVHVLFTLILHVLINSQLDLQGSGFRDHFCSCSIKRF